MATERTKALTAERTSTAELAFNPPRLKPASLKRAQALKPGERPAIAVHTDHRGCVYAFDGVSIRRVQG